MPPTRPSLVATAVLAAVTFTACDTDEGPTGSQATPTATAGPRLLDTAKVERAIVRSVRDQRDTAARVTCPDRVLQRRGTVFTCSATSRVGDATFEVTVTDDSGVVTYVAK